MRSPAFPALIVIAATTCSASCAPVDARAARGDLIADALVDDNRDLLLRDANEVALKWGRMAESPFLFLRGNVGLWARDMSAPGAPPIAIGDDDDAAAASAVLLVGDPHPENFGTFRDARGIQVYDLNDFDSAGYGPFFFDVRRLALGFAVGLHDVDAAHSIDVGVAVAEGYVDAAANDDDNDALVTIANAPAIVGDLLTQAIKDVAQGSPVALVDATHIATTNAPTPRGPDDQFVAPLDDDARASIVASLASIGVNAIDVAREYGSGVGSYAVFRDFALLDDGTTLELKEARDPLRAVGGASGIDTIALAPNVPFDDNATREVFAQRTLQAEPDEDTRLAAAHGFKVKNETAWQKTQRIARIEKLVGKGTPWSDVIALARLDGALLYRAHARGPLVDGRSGADVLRPLVSKHANDIVADARAFLAHAVGAHDDDYALFCERLAADPLLGWRP